MGKTLFQYNEDKLAFEEFKTPKSTIFLRLFVAVISIAILSGVVATIKFQYFPSSESEAYKRELRQMEIKYLAINNQLEQIGENLQNVQNKDANVYRLVFGLDPLDEDVINAGVGGVDRYSDIVLYDQTGQMVKSTQQRVDRLERMMQIQNFSLDTLVYLAQNREKMLASIPSIKPVREDKLRRKITLLSGYGMRIHPVHKTKKMHRGIDFTAPKGTPIYATGDGVVERVEKKKYGYGINIIINHGFGFKTLYAHMSQIDVKRGDTVHKGQQIGEIGNTGTSTAPHLHYEVRKNGVTVNPILYCMDGLSTKEYQSLVEKASVENQSLD